jgi:hypothetical protein
MKYKNMLDKLIVCMKEFWQSYNKLLKEIFSITVIWVSIEIIVDPDPDLNLLFLSYVRVWALYSLGEAIYDEYKRRRK